MFTVLRLRVSKCSCRCSERTEMLRCFPVQGRPNKKHVAYN
uniref:Uncharacterized protein n=1 Tax=Anguilla anguilla TaxID=7936 RepID=A0A0E9SVI6_ANGAN